MKHDSSFDRRQFLKAGTAALALAGGLAAIGKADAAAATGMADPHPASNRLLTRIAFGSCSKESKEQPVWDKILATNPDLFIFLGDNIYGDTRDMELLKEKYRRQYAHPGYRKLRETVPHVAIWDDHDYGENDAGADYPMKEASRRIFLDQWNEPADSPRRSRNGVYASYLFGPQGRRVQVILPDLRYNRTPIRKADLGGKPYDTWADELKQSGSKVPGPYARNPDKAATMLGERQWEWLEAQLRMPAEVRIFASSLQVLADFPGWESWVNYARDHQRLIELIRKTGAGGLVFVSGDTHYAELSRLDVNVPYPLWDLTASGLTETWPVEPPNDNRVGEVIREVNFGMIEIDWRAGKIGLQARDTNNNVRLSQSIELRQLRG